MNILEKIVIQKKIEVELVKQAVSIKQLEQTEFFKRSTISITSNILQENSTGIIAEFKRKSPSKGIINDTSKVLDVVKAYENAGVCACSILTDDFFFGGTKQDIISVRNEIHIPILRKDFMIDEYQFIEAKAIGADVVLLIASILTPKQVKEFTALARSLQLEVLLELHDETELN
ncbi:MAG TPA: indole-3-glycerol phosphate synthase TrpC, partial [Chitinophagales bacterium]|nr:indole-3-glycerol phosphate synthase TrpC [Chitinophagales bacterium]